ncbi:MAG: primase alpha helix C-terminal domain-containing protein [Collinsella sp.]
MEPTTGLEPTHSPNYQGYKLPERISEGERNQQLYSYASHLQAKMYSDEDSRTDGGSANAERCDPLLSENEVEKIIKNATKYPKGRDPEYERKNGSVTQCTASAITVPDFISDITVSEHPLRLIAAFYDGCQK